MHDDDSPFLAVPASDWLAANDHAFAIADRFPVSPGHALVVPRRAIATWWEASDDERAGILALIDELKGQLDAELRPDGYNVGFNAGAAAGRPSGTFTSTSSRVTAVMCRIRAAVCGMPYRARAVVRHRRGPARHGAVRRAGARQAAMADAAGIRGRQPWRARPAAQRWTGGNGRL